MELLCRASRPPLAVTVFLLSSEKCIYEHHHAGNVSFYALTEEIIMFQNASMRRNILEVTAGLLVFVAEISECHRGISISRNLNE